MKPEGLSLVGSIQHVAHRHGVKPLALLRGGWVQFKAY